MKYYCVKNSNKFLLEGSKALSEGFNRLYKEDIIKLNNINQNLISLSKLSSGITLKFKTNSSNINIKAKVLNKAKLSHLTAVADSGFDLYIFDEESKSYKFYNTTKHNINNNEYDVNVVKFNEKIYRKYLIYFPLYSKVTDLKIGLDKNAVVSKGDKYKDKIIIYGTSITQGASASRPGLSYSNILSRKLNTEIYNFGFSGQAFLEEGLASLLTKDIDHKIFIIDVEANAGIDERLINNLDGFYNEYRKYHKDTKVLIASRITYSFDLFDSKLKERRERNFKFLKEFVSKNDNVYFLNGYEIFTKDINEMTVDGIHPNDLGMMKIAEAFYKKISKSM